MDDKARGLGDTERPGGRVDEDVRAYVRNSDLERPDAGSEYAAPPSRDTAPASATGETDTRRTEEIRAEIEQTRENMSETIEAIQERLRPRNIVAQATGSVRSATSEKVKQMANTAGETASQVAEQTREAAEYVVEGAKQNAIPAVLIGLGAAWLMMNRSGGDSARVPRYVNTRGEITGGDGGLMDRIKNNPVPATLAGVGLAWLAFAGSGSRSANWRGSEYYRGPGEGYGDRSYGAYERGSVYSSEDTAFETGAGTGKVTNRVTERARDYAQGAASSAREYAHEATDTAREYARDATETVRHTTRRAQTQFQRLMRENPLLVGAAAAVLGAAVGAALPETETENEWLGETRDTVVERAQDMAREAAGKVQEKASQVADAATSVKDTLK